jgi:hypothetical protein
MSKTVAAEPCPPGAGTQADGPSGATQGKGEQCRVAGLARLGAFSNCVMRGQALVYDSSADDVAAADCSRTPARRS